MHNRIIMKPLAIAALLSLGLATGACSTDEGRSKDGGLESVHQPVVHRDNYTLDLVTGSGGLSLPEQRRLAGWFESLDLKYGDRIALDDPLASPATRETVSSIAGRYGLLLADGAPVTPGYVDPGKARVVITRTSAKVPGCPNWEDTQASNASNSTWSGYGCAINGNLAAMVANPEDLIRGQRGTGETVVMSSSKAIDSYRKQVPTGEKGLKENTTNEGSN